MAGEPKPLVKWVGGKRQLLKELKKNMPKSYNRYFEPFVGGGALFFSLRPKEAFINDYNEELINLYRVVKQKPFELIEDLKKHKNEKEYYYKIRGLDRDPLSYKKLSDVKRAGRFVFLNKTCFNGLYRVNKKNEFNSPYGRYKNPAICDEKNILLCSRVLQNSVILNEDFKEIKKEIKKGDFIYLDPPYVPLNQTSNFTAYTDRGFDKKMQFELKEFCDYIDRAGGYFMLSNSYTDFVLELYRDYRIKTVTARRAVNCKASRRGSVKELLIRNYGQ